MKVIGASRTDAGVHARGNVAVFDTKSPIPPEIVRERIKRGIWTFGSVVTRKESGNAQKNTYEINKHKLADFLGIPVEEVDRRLGA